MDIKELNKLDYSVRASQAVVQYGIGSMVDFKSQTLMPAKLEYWECSKEIKDDRLVKRLGVTQLKTPDAGSFEKIPYVRFPEWYFCPNCRSLKPLKEWIEEFHNSQFYRNMQNNPRYQDNLDTNMLKYIRCFGHNCGMKGTNLVPARFIQVCENGHIQDFPWNEWAHNCGTEVKKCTSNKSELKITNHSRSGGLEGITIECKSCGASANMRNVFKKDGFKNINSKLGATVFKCKGNHPWKGPGDICNCGAEIRALERGASSVYFPVNVTSLVIPLKLSELEKLVTENSNYLQLVQTKANMGMGWDNVKSQMIDTYAGLIANQTGTYSKDEIAECIENLLSGESNQQDSANSDISTEENEYRKSEYAALIKKSTDEDSQKYGFVCEPKDITKYNEKIELPYVKSISLVNKLREVQACVGFSRLQPLTYSKAVFQNPKFVSIKDYNTSWYPATQIHGEGIFIEFDDEKITEWIRNNSEIFHRGKILNSNYNKTLMAKSRPRKIYSKFVMLHTIAHLLIKQLSFDCGYNIASLKERIYCSSNKDKDRMCGILIYTACGDTNGTLGGLVRQGEPDIFPFVFKKAIESARICSNDPVCSCSEGQGNYSFNLAACHSCCLIPETSCEEFNGLLDRAMIVGTLDERNLKGLYSDDFLIKSEDAVESSNQLQDISTSEEEEVHESVIIRQIEPGNPNTDISSEEIWEYLFEDDDDILNQDFCDGMREAYDRIDGDNLEKPLSSFVFSINHSKESYKCDLYWKESKIMYFSAWRKSQYDSIIQKLAGTEWKCFCGAESDLTAEQMINWMKN